eukprot:TRINITY_DN1246_c0_g1_i7.p1 TRINITY_DN1246_c0_g1~~TRINITY_DN1246_c0_g1_i7.p1  ORF type:complete len:239 (-),score=-26.63 TRINITY_DN1246_c0_g1_i7:79-795(-)
MYVQLLLIGRIILSYMVLQIKQILAVIMYSRIIFIHYCINIIQYIIIILYFVKNIVTREYKILVSSKFLLIFNFVNNNNNNIHGYKIYDDEINLLQYLLVSQMLESRQTFMMRLIQCNHCFCSFKASYILKCKIWKIFNFVNTFMIRLIYCNSYQSVRCQRVDRLLFLVLLISILIIIFIMIIIQQKLDVSLKQNCSKIAIQVDPRECMQRLLQVDQRECIHYTRVFFQYHYIGAGKN